MEVVDTLHYGVNDGDDTAEIIVFYAGVEGLPITVYAECRSLDQAFTFDFFIFQ